MNTRKQEEIAMLDMALLEAVDTLSQGLAKAAIINRRTCVHCGHFTQAETCKLSPTQARPPARIIAFGCPRFEDMDDVPF
jgi:recombinational DNA repair protein RecR